MECLIFLKRIMKKNKDIIEFEIYEVYNDYINHLRKYDSCVEKSEDDSYKKNRKYLAVTLKNGENYLIPFSSPKASDYDSNGKARRSITPIIRITEYDSMGKIRILGKLKNSSMIPVKDVKEIKKYDITQEKDNRYRDLIYKELKFIQKNKEFILNAANRIYFEKNQNKDLGYIKHTVDFKILEKAALEYSKVKSLSNSIDSPKEISNHGSKKVTININQSKSNKTKVKQASRSNTVKVRAKKLSKDKGNDHEL